MPDPVTFPTKVNEKNSWRLIADLTKDDGTPLGSDSLETLTLTLYDLTTMDPAVHASGIINGLDGVNILNTGRGTINAAGHLVVALESADNPMVDPTLPSEKHKALIIGTWNTGKGYTSLEAIFTVRNIAKVPT